MRDALSGDDPAPAEALSAWREASTLLREGDFVRTHRLQSLAAAALEASGDAAAAKAAGERARQAFESMRGALPEPLRGSFADRDAEAIAALGTPAP